MNPASGPLREVARVGVGSTNPPKIAGVRAALASYAPQVSVQGVAVESGVSEQPVGFEEIVQGARARARGAAASDSAEPFDLAVGYEDGLVRLPTGDADNPEAWFNLGCAAVQRGETVRLGFSSGFAYPPACAERAAREQEPIGGLFDALFNSRAEASEVASELETPSSLGLGNVGKLTRGVVDRAEYTRHAVVCALTGFLHPELYSKGAGR